MATKQPGTPGSQAYFNVNFNQNGDFGPEIPVIDSEEPFFDVVKKLSEYINHTITTAHSFEQLRNTTVGNLLKPLIAGLSDECHNRGIIAALLTLKWLFMNMEADDGGINESRGFACEIVAWQFLTYLNQHELIDFLLYELPLPPDSDDDDSDAENATRASHRAPRTPPDERTGLLEDLDTPAKHLLRGPHRPNASTLFTNPYQMDTFVSDVSPDNDPTLSFAGLNSLEIAAIADAKKFLSQRVVQKVITDIWNGEIVFWDALSVKAQKKASIYNKRTADPYSRLRVPKYQKAFEAVFFASFLALYYAVLVQRNQRHITPIEVLLYVWIAAFAYDEFGEYWDAGYLFYQTDFWSFWDLGIIGIGIAFLITRIIGLMKHNDETIELAFDILSLEAMFLVPRICSLLSLNPYFGSLLPVLKEMTRAFLKFLIIIVILYIGFLTTFTMLARDEFTVGQMCWLLVKVFFGSSYLGFDIAYKISFGVPLMLIFVCMTNILLISALISLLSNSLAEVMKNAREQYLFQYSVYVLESSNSKKLTYFMPPLNLISLCFRPLRLCFRAESVRSARILVLKVTHLPFVAIIWAYESSQQYVHDARRVSPLLSSGSESGVGGAPAPTPGRKRFPAANRSSLLAPSTGKERQGQYQQQYYATSSENTPRPPIAGSADSVADLMAMVEKLSSQVDELTSIVTSQKE